MFKYKYQNLLAVTLNLFLGLLTLKVLLKREMLKQVQHDETRPCQ